MRERLLARIGSLAVARPYRVLGVALLGAAVSIALLPALIRLTAERGSA